VRGGRLAGGLVVSVLLIPFAAWAQIPQDSLPTWRLRVEAQAPRFDDLGALDAAAREAARAGETERFYAFLDSVVSGASGGGAGRAALQYWGALELDGGGDPASVARTYDRWLADRPSDGDALGAFVTVLLAHHGVDAAGWLVDRAIERGADPAWVALAQGAVAEARGDARAAASAWARALGGERRAGDAEGRIAGLLAGSPSEERAAAVREALEEAAGEAGAGARSRLVPLLARAYALEGRWDEAVEAVRDASLSPVTRATILRSVAERAREREAWDAAGRAIEAVLEIGPPVATPGDRLARAEIARRSGDPAAAARLAAGTGTPGARIAAAEYEVLAARQSGDPERLARAVARAREAGLRPEAIAVPAGDLALAAGRPDSALGAYDAAILGADEGDVGPAGLEALARQRLVLALLRSRVPESVLVGLGHALVEGPADPTAAAETLEGLAERVDREEGDGRAVLLGLAAEWRGRAGDARGASEALERAAGDPNAGAEAPRLLLAAGAWARAAGDDERARALWREVATGHADTPYALEARRLLATGSGPAR